MVTLRWASASDVGRVREANEDNLYCSARLFAVADGMGGHAAGDVASELAVRTLAAADGRLASVDDLVAAIDQAAAAILQAGQQRPDWHGLGTTLTGVAIIQVAGTDHWAVFNVGDSRVYRYHDGQLHQLTVDHSAVQELLTAGLITPEQAESHPQRNVVTRYLGSQPLPVPDLKVYEQVPGERLLLCSDGLSGELADIELAQVLTAFSDPDEATAELIRRANQAGGHDNVTVVLVQLDAD